MKHIGLFEGIGGFSLAAQWMGWETIAWCEWNEFGQKVLRHHFPEAEGFGDITKTDFKKYANKIDILTGGFPCQPYSLAGKRKGKDDERHLWPEMLRAIREIQPRWVVGENVSGLINWNGGMVFDEVQTDLETEGYEVWPYVLPACAVNAPHRRDRVWFVAYSRHNSKRKAGSCTNDEGSELATLYTKGQRRKCQAIFNSGLCDLQGDATNSNSNGQHGSNSQHEINTSEGWEYAQRNIEQMGGDAANTDSRRISGHRGESKGKQIQATESNQDNSKQFGRMGWEKFPTQSPICSRDDGFPGRLDGITFSKWRNESIKAYGNAIVPQVAYQIFKAINILDK